MCAVGAGCTKRYRQMNGLKVSFGSSIVAVSHGTLLTRLQYHYLNSGEHGQYGLRMLQNGTHPQPPSVPTPPPKRYPPSSTSAITNSRPSAAPYHIPSHHQSQQNSSSTGHNPAHPHHHHLQNGTGTNTNTASSNVNANTTNTTPKATMPRMGVWPSKPTTLNTTPLANRTPQQQQQQPRQPIIPPITKGKDAVLYSNVGSTDPMDIMSRMD